MLYYAHFLVNVRGSPVLLPIPGLWQIFLEFAAFALINEVIFYYAHRLLVRKGWV
jgi:hypothetical protein